MNAAAWIFVASAICGHVTLWVMLFNRLHSTGWPCALLKLFDKILFALFAAIPLGVGFWLVTHHQQLIDRAWNTATDRLIFSYWMLGCAAGIWVVISWLWRRFLCPGFPGLISNDTASIDVAAALKKTPIGNLKARLLSYIPGNQPFQLDVNTKSIELPNLDSRLDGLSIAHLSDLHYTGGISRDYFEFVIDRVNEFEADLVAVTGDIVDYAKYLEWIPGTLGRLNRRFGVYFVLGNHDKRVRDVARLRQCLTESGLVDVGSTATVVPIHDVPVLLAGNELPWFGTRQQIDEALKDKSAAFRVLLSHAPDQLPWARDRNFDLMLAGHNHGGQIRLPWIGPLVAPSRYGVKYASGLFHEPPTTLHVSRGVSAQYPIRINCPQEVTKLVLRSSSTDPS